MTAHLMVEVLRMLTRRVVKEDSMLKYTVLSDA